jgi:type 1 glutamine amidotransferase
MTKKKLLLYQGGRVSHKRIHKLFQEILTDYVIESYKEVDVFNNRDFFPQYETAIFFSQLGDLTDEQEKNILDFVSEKGLVGLHGATASFKDRPKYFEMLGGRFVSHKRIQEFEIKILDRSHQTTNGLEDFSFKDEPYRHDFSTGEGIHVLAEADYQDKKDPKPEPMMWVKTYGKGKVFFCALGHKVAALKTEIYRLIIRRAVEWVIE